MNFDKEIPENISSFFWDPNAPVAAHGRKAGQEIGTMLAKADNDPTTNRVLSEVVAAEMLGFSVDTLRRLCERGEGPPRLRLSPRRIGYRVRDLEIWLDERARRVKA